MAKARKKKRSQNVPQSNGGPPGKAGTSNRLRVPQSMVIRMGAGEVGSSVSQLASDFRDLVAPHTAARLKERKSNKLRDYTTMAGPLGVTHFFLFSRSNSGNVHLRFALHPRGPTMQFRIEDYVLCKDIQQSQKHSRQGWQEAFDNPPLLVQHGMLSSEEQLEGQPKQKQVESLAQTMFSAMFPTITPGTTKLESIKRIFLLKRERQVDGTFVLNLRHYAITTRRAGISKEVRRFDAHEQRRREKKGRALPNLGQLEDMADYILDPGDTGYTSASETEMDTDNEVDVVQTSAHRVKSRKEMERIRSGEKKANNSEARSRVEKRAVKLIELGPRIKMRLVKVEDGFCEGKVMWNEFVNKTNAEEQQLDQRWNERRKEKEERRRQQRENVERKKQLKQNTRTNTGANGQEEEEDEAEWDTDEIEDMLEQEAEGTVLDADQEEEDESAYDEEMEE